MRVVAYCRVSTNKNEQLDSLEAQQNFFNEYSNRNNYNLVKIYADEGKSGTKMRNRTALLKLLSDANKHLFDMVLIKDVSRLARNTLDFLISIRKLKTLGIKVVFINYDQTSSDSSEFMLTMLSAIAQEESANTSKRVKFGKKINAENGKVPNLVYGYDKIPGDIFNLKINENEANIVKQIFIMYTEQNIGENKIAHQLNQKGLKTKRNCKWSQNAISRILSNELYIGKIINGKETVEDFLTGKRKAIDESKWLITEKPELRIIDEKVFQKAKQIKSNRRAAFNLTGERSDHKHIFSKLIKCGCCGASFRRSVRKYKNVYVKWICNNRNHNGVQSCPNKFVVDEKELLNYIKKYFLDILKNKKNIKQYIINEFNKKFKEKFQNETLVDELDKQLNRLIKSKQKYMDMFDNDIIDIEELKNKNLEINVNIDKTKKQIELFKLNISKNNLLNNIVIKTFDDIEKFLSISIIDSDIINRIIEKIVVSKEGEKNIYLRLFDDIGLNETVHI